MIKTILGRIIGKVTTSRFEFLVENETRKFDYCQVYHKSYDYVLCQVVELEKTSDRIIARCIVIGYKDSRGRIRQARSPFDVGTEVLKAEEEFIKKIVMLDEHKKGAYIGLLEGTHIPVYIDLNKLLTRHVAVLAKSGSGKSYSVGVLLEEIMEKNVPLLIIDPHGEYVTLKQENENKNDIKLMDQYNIKPKSYARKIVVYGDTSIDPGQRPLQLNENMTSDELIDLLPTRLSNSQSALLFSTIKDLDSLTFDSLILGLQASENNQKWNLINIIEYLKKLGIFSANPTSLNEIVQSGRCSIVNLKGIDPAVQEIIVYKLLRDLFHERKLGKLPPFFLVMEEAHNFVPEKGFSEAISSKVVKTIASEGRKFGLGLCVVSQRPAIVQKTVLSQCTTQIILKITNPNDLKAISNSVEGITWESENEIKNLPVGTALITGIVDMPLLVSIRPRKTRHGGEAVDILGMQEEEEKFFDDLKDFKDKKLMPVIRPKITPKDIRLMSEKDVTVKTVLIPCELFLCESKSREFNLLIEMVNGSIVQDIEGIKIRSAFLPELSSLAREELKILETAFRLKRFTSDELIKKTGSSLDAAGVLGSLAEKGYLIKNGDTYEISERYILSDLAKHAFYSRIEFVKVDYEEILPKKQRIDVIKAKLSRFTQIKDHRECFLVHHTVQEGDG